MSGLTFDKLKAAWVKMRDERIDDFEKLVGEIDNPNQIYLKRISETETELAVQFLGFTNALNDANNLSKMKRTIVMWLKKIAMMVQVVRSDPDSLILKVSKELKIGESRKNKSGRILEHKYKKRPVPRGTDVVRIVTRSKPL